MARPRSQYCLKREELIQLLQQMPLKEALRLWQALGEDPKDFPLPANPQTLSRTIRKLRGEAGADGAKPPKPPAYPSGEKAKTPGLSVRPGADEEGPEPLAKPPKPLAYPSGERRKTRGPSVRYPDPAGALAQELGGWRANLLYRARREENRVIQELAHCHRNVLLAFLNLAEAIPMPRRVPTALAWIREVLEQAKRLGDDAVIRVFQEVQRRSPENPLSYAAKVLQSQKTEVRKWNPTGELF